MATNSQLNLTQAAAVMRNVIKYGAILLVCLMIGRVVMNSAIATWKALNPPPPPPPTMGFGPLPRIVFPESQPKPAEYRLESLVQPNQFPDRMNVYFIPPRQASLLSVERAKEKAAAMGYLFEPEILTPERYRWTSASPIFSTLEMNIFTNTFSIETNWPSHPELLSGTQALNADTVVSRVKGFVQKAGSLTPDISTGIVKTAYIKSLGGQFTQAASQSDADFVQVDLFRKNINDLYPTVTAYAHEGPIHAVATSNGTILEMRMDLFNVEYSQVETYPIRSVQQAWELFSAGEGYVASTNSPTNVVVRDIYLAYFEPNIEQSYYQPVYVFEGDQGFVGYVEAIAPTAFQQPNLTPS